MEKSKIKNWDIIKYQPNWIKEFLQTIKISQRLENMSLNEMEFEKLEEHQQGLFLEIPLHKSKNFEKQAQDFQDSNCPKDLYVENAHRLLLWMHNEQIKFSWQEEFYTNSAAYDPYQVIKRLSEKEKSNKNPISISPYEDFKFQLQIDGICYQNEVKITAKSVKVNFRSLDKDLETTIPFNHYPQPLQHFIKELLWYADDWQQYYFMGNTNPTWKIRLNGHEDLVLQCTFNQYVEVNYGESFLRQDLKGAPKLIYGQLLEYSENDSVKFQILKEGLLEYYRVEEKWPKDMLEVVLIHYDKNFVQSIDGFDEQIIFISMRYFGIPFLPSTKSNLQFFDLIGELRPDLLIGDYGDFVNDFLEWKDWIG